MADQMPSKIRVPRGKLYCCVPLCHNYSGKMVDETPVKLHRIPKIAKFKRLWINGIKNVRKNFKPSNSTRVCSVHFEGGNGPKPWCKIPTIFPLKPAPKSPTPKRSLPRRVTKNSENLFGVCFHDYTPLLSPVDSMKTTEEDKTRCSRGTQTEIEKKDFGVQVCIPSVTAEDLKGNDEKTRFYTGFVNFATFMVIFKSLEQFTEKLNYWKGKDSLKEKNYLVDEVTQKPGPQRKMRLLDEFLMVLMRLRLGLLEQDLAQRFCVSSSTVSRILITWYNVLAEHFKHFIVWPTKETIQDHMPESFKRFPNTRVILDCTEFFIETPSSFVNQSVTYSSYKSHNTFKLLVGSSPTGAVTFLSKLWGGNASDKHIVKESGLLNLLEKGDSVMADKGFNMKDLLEPLVVTLNMPPMRDSNRQLSTKEVEQTRRIASVRIHVERKMEQIKNFRILRGTIPDTEWHNANNIVLICAALTNLEPPLVK